VNIRHPLRVVALSALSGYCCRLKELCIPIAFAWHTYAHRESWVWSAWLWDAIWSISSLYLYPPRVLKFIMRTAMRMHSSFEEQDSVHWETVCFRLSSVLSLALHPLYLFMVKIILYFFAGEVCELRISAYGVWATLTFGKDSILSNMTLYRSRSCLLTRSHTHSLHTSNVHFHYHVRTSQIITLQRAQRM